MIANQGSLLTSANLFGKTQYKSRKDLWVVRCSGITCWIGRGNIVSHLLGTQETNSRLVYHTHTHVISKVCLSSKPGLLMFNEPWGFLNTKVMGHLRKRGLPSSPSKKEKRGGGKKRIK